MRPIIKNLYNVAGRNLTVSRSQNPDYLVLISALIGFAGGFYFWRKNYAAATQPMLNEIDSMLEDL